ncbi:MAG: hypothetical protein C4K60_09955 [Ideonella sp. MAG2]|nr:MAG: hypothetical protein C4K60_09955 [Ideonella sp. MAG2]
MNHIFVYVVRASQDPFWGIKQAILSEGRGKVVDVRFSESEFDHIDKVEYSRRRFFRAFYYPGIFACLAQRLTLVLDALQGQPAKVYFSDEGVWAVFWMQFRQRYSPTQIQGVNVQHGLAEPKVGRFMSARHVLNRLSRLVTGYPCLGLGSLGGAGPGAFETYLTYDEVAAKFVRERTGAAAHACPRLIKADLITKFRKLTGPTAKRISRALFAMNIKMRGSAIKCDVGQTFDQLLEMAQLLDGMGVRLVVRLHPGMNTQQESLRFEQHPIAKFAELDPHVSLHESMAQVQMVMSFYSTVLWEAGLLGLASVQVVCPCCDTAKLEFERRLIQLDGDLKCKLADLIASEQSRMGSHNLASIESDWTSVRQALHA